MKMRKFVINVNGNQYEVEVEEVGGVSQPVTYVAPVAVAAPAAPAAPVAAAAPQAAAPKAAPAAASVSSGPSGAIKVNAPMPGTILDVKVKPGQAVKKGDVLMILEAMKMEYEIVAAQAGTIASINTSKAASVNSGELLITMNG